MNEHIERLPAQSQNRSDRTPCRRCGCPVAHAAAHDEFHRQIDHFVRRFERQESARVVSAAAGRS